ncbi:MAG: mechanosensitive ion channel [Acidobacteriota bacterium]|nr:mechanosensitive ion channel family protein [Blastocatellia bacterium]MDW8412310.1 mechanosensitive ion channel [Acidobacteriota bacterium]
MLIQGFATDDWLDQLSVLSILEALVIIVITYLLVKLSGSLIAFLSKKAPRARLFFLFASPIVRFVLWGGATILVVALLVPSRESLLAVLASLGLAVALGAQELVKNLVGGLVIIFNRPYQVGDKVRMGEAYGEIDHIGILSTKLTTLDDTRVTIPNSSILASKIWNSNSGSLDCQVVTKVYVPQQVCIDKARRIAYEVAYTSPYLLLNKPVQVLVSDRLERVPCILVEIKAYVYDHRYEQDFQSDLLLRVKTEYQRQRMLDWGGTSLSVGSEEPDSSN